MIFFLHFWVIGKQISFWHCRDFVDQTQLSSSPWPSALCWVGGDRSSHRPMATGQAPGPAGRSAHLWASSSPMPHIIPWIQTAQALGGRGRSCKGCGFLCDVSSSAGVIRFRSLLTKVRPELLEAGGTQVATAAFHPFLVEPILPSEAFRKYFPSAVPAHLRCTIFFQQHNLRSAFTIFSQCVLISYFLTFWLLLQILICTQQIFSFSSDYL